MSAQSRRPLPIGLQTFREIRETGCYYVDKTEYARRMAAPGAKHYFLSRPRRFGKSLFLDTLRELFLGAEELFRGLAIHDDWDWSVRHPVLRLSFGRGNYKEPDAVRATVTAQLRRIERAADLPAGDDADMIANRLADLVEALHETAGQRVVLLVDEYDKPILDALDEPEVATANRDALRGLYGTVKDCDAHLRLSFFTGVSKFSNASLFSGLNQLEDITLDPRFSEICGYTDNDLDTVFAPEFDPDLEPLDRDDIRDRYDGYCWLGDEKLYNPISVLRSFDRRACKNWWFVTGTPAFLVETMAANRMLSVDLENITASEAALSTFDVGDIAPEALAFQTGYLTIAGHDGGADGAYTLDYPNREVRESLNLHLLRTIAGPGTETAAERRALRRILASGDADGLEAKFRTMLSGVACQWHADNPMARYEGWYAGMIYSYFVGAGYDVRVGDSADHGRVDLVLRLPEIVWIFGFRVAGRAGAGSALQQIVERGYAGKCRDGRRIVQVGVECDEAARNLDRFEAAEA